MAEGLILLFESYKKILVNKEQILKNTDLRVVSLLGSGIHFQKDGCQPVDRLLTSQVGYESDRTKNRQKISFDYRLPQSQVVAKRIIDEIYASDFDTKEFGKMVDDKVTNFLQNTDKQLYYIDILELNDFKIRYGITRDSEANYFWIEIQKQ